MCEMNECRSCVKCKKAASADAAVASTTVKPLNLDYVFTQAEGGLGSLWSVLCGVENYLAVLLHPLPQGTAVGIEGHAWTLRDDGEKLVLVHIACASTSLTKVAVQASESRFDFDLDWVDVGEEELKGYISLVQQAIDAFKASTSNTFVIEGASIHSGEQRWARICDQQGWSGESQVIHLEGFLRDKGLFDEFAAYAQKAAAEESTVENTPAEE